MESRLLNIILLFFLALKVFAFSVEPFALLTIPKSGSHLMIKALHYMTGMASHWHTHPPEVEQLFLSSYFPYTHFGLLSPSLIRFYTDHPLKQLIGVRDLRDVCVSIVYQIRKGEWPDFSRKPHNREMFNRLSFDEQLLFVIQQGEWGKSSGLYPGFGIRRAVNQAMALIGNPTVLVCRYEDLVGSRGGGTDQAQRILLEKIAQHIGLKLDDAQIDKLALHLYGNEINPFGQGDFINYQSTFREGKIGTWKSAFKEKHKIAFKERLGEFIIALGYEKDDVW